MMMDSESESDAEEHEEMAETIQEESKFRFLEKDMSKLLVMMITKDRQSLIRTDMNRFDLLEEGRQGTSTRATTSPHRSTASSTLPPPHTLQSCSASLTPLVPRRGRSTSTRQQGDMLPKEHLLGVTLQLRDIRFLQGVSEPALLVRRGAIVVSLDPINAIITHSAGYLLIPDGADHVRGTPSLPSLCPVPQRGPPSPPRAYAECLSQVLEPLLATLREGEADGQSAMPFEFFLLEALLVTLITSHMRDIKDCMQVPYPPSVPPLLRLKPCQADTRVRLELQEAKSVLQQIRKKISSRLLSRVLKLKKRINEVTSIPSKRTALPTQQAAPPLHTLRVRISRSRERLLCDIAAL